MSKVLFDVNVVLDILLDRQPHAEASEAAFAAAETGKAEGFLAAHAVTTIHYLVRREMSAARAQRLIRDMLRVLSIASVDEAVIQEALQLSCPDFENAVTAAAARQAGCDYIATRDGVGFRGSSVRPLTPEVLVSILAKA